MNIQNNLHEMKIKMACASWLEEKYNKFSDGIIINEFSSNKSKARADLAYVSTEELVAIEIKSSKDKLSRLSAQIKFLKECYNRVEVVTTKRHMQVAREICILENVGLHIVEDNSIITILKGRRRNISKESLERRIFPAMIRKRRDFTPTEEYYKKFLLKKYTQEQIRKTEGLEITECYIRSLNPNHMKRTKAEQRRLAYQHDLESLFKTLQSAHSSSNS
ncbi:sce7726 family protein [Pararhizobium arenae]|uniref:sce7726 family protein n=1 Tax=Pararhizobium arenae TaxID=1856850 RepID=UPI000A9C2F0A|nr:sce7726 family protein [Pararhizobium arenae]